jgi:signal transduction histidine kinase
MRARLPVVRAPRRHLGTRFAHAHMGWCTPPWKTDMPPRAEALWIVHADPAARAALRGLVGAETGVEGAPGELTGEETPPPGVVVLHVGAELPAALDFAHRTGLLHPEARWVLLRDERVPAETVADAFADLGATVLAWPSEAERVAAAVARAGRGAPTGLRARREREVLVRRFVRTLGDVGLPDLGGLASGRAVIRGEGGTGKLLTARVIHALAEPPGAFVHAPCAGPDALRELAARLAAAAGTERVVACLDRPERLGREAQRELAGWIELGPPSLGLDPERTVWIALVAEVAGATPLLEPSLALALAGLELALPPLRTRPAVAERFTVATLRALASAAGAPARELSPGAAERIRSAPWPGNFRELEAALRRAVAAGGAGPVGPDELGLAGAPPPAARPVAAAPAPLRAPEPERTAEPEPEPAHAITPPANRALLQALSHSLRNPLVSLKTFATLLPERFADEEFRLRFHAQAEHDLAALERHLDRLARFAELVPGPAKPVNVAALLETLLHERRAEIRRRRLLVLSELGADAPWALASEEAVRFAFEALFDAAFAQIRDRQDLYIACRRPAAQPSGAPALRVLLRFHGAPIAKLPAGGGRPSPALLELVLAEAALEPSGGRIAYESLANDEQVLRVDLPAS